MPTTDAIERIDLRPTHTFGTFKLRPGRALPFGATVMPGGINFSVASRYATSCSLVLFVRGNREPMAEIPFSDEFRIGNVFAMIVFDLDIEKFLSRDVGHDAGKTTGLDIAWQSVVRIMPLIAPGFEYYGTINDVAHPGPASAQEHLIGPVLTGAYNFSPYGKLKYEVGYLWGLTPASGRSAIRWRLEYEIAF